MGALDRISGIVALLFGLLLLGWAAASSSEQTANELQQTGRWVVSSGLPPPSQRRSGPAPAPTGGYYLHELHLQLHQSESLVIDFKSSSVLAHYHHTVFDSHDNPIAHLEGGLRHSGGSDYFLRHGRKLLLPAGSYRIVTRLESPFFLAEPTPFVYREHQYLEQLRYSQALTLTGMGIFFALAFYYLVMGIWRRAATDLLYAGFIIGNLLFNASAQLVFKDLFGWQWFYGVSAPILVSNVIYIAFVMVLLGVNRIETPRLFNVGIAAIALLISFWPVALLMPNWSLELCRYGVAVFALYGLSAGISQSLARNRVAYFYLIANAAFVIPAFFAISSKTVEIADYLLIEHIGMLAVLIEVLLLAQVMSYQIGQVYKERAQQEVAAEQAGLLANLTAQVPGVIYQFRMTPDGRFSAPFASNGLREIFGLSPAEVREDATPALQRVYPPDYADFIASIEQSARTMAPWVHEFRVAIPGQGLQWRAGNSQPQRQDDGSIMWHGFITNATERKTIEQRIQHMAQHDPLTNLPNRALFMDRLEHALEQAKRQRGQVALMFVDLDNFKTINDRYGHHVGDGLLQKVAQQLTLSLRASDTAARIGGDEFVVLLHPVNNADDALTVARKIQVALKTPFAIGDVKLQASASIGIALYPEHGHSPAVLIRAADAAMYQTKQSGRDNINVYSKESL